MENGGRLCYDFGIHTMNNDADRFDIGGNMVTYGYSGYFHCSAGEMTVGGGWTNYDLYTNPSGSFKLTFTGTDDLKLWGKDEIYVPTLVIENASDRTITMEGTIRSGSLIGDGMQITARNTPNLSFDNTLGAMDITGNVTLAVAAKAMGGITIHGDLYSNGLTMGSSMLTVNGDLYLKAARTLTIGRSGKLNVSGDVHMNAGTLSLAGTTSISGSLYQSAGDLRPNGGTVYILGDYRLQSADESTGELEWGNSSGNLYMTNDRDCIIVGGNFIMQSNNAHSGKLTAGTLVVMGDFTQLSGNAHNFAASGTHKVLLCGTDLQNVSFQNTESRFQILHLSGKQERYRFTPNPCWNTLEENVDVPAEYYGETVAQGSCGTDVRYTLTDKGVLLISGSGAMKNYTYKSEMPWYAKLDQIKVIVIQDGVTSIGDYAFYGAPNLNSIRITESVTSIGDYAFKNCPVLDGVVLPSGLTKLGESAFYACSGLTAIEIPASLWTIQPYTFKNCTALAEVIFHEGNLMKISDGAFYNTAVTELVLPDCLSILDVYSFKNCAKLGSITLGSGLSQIREAVFYGTAIPTIEIPEGVTSIGPYAFKNCVALETIELPETLSSVGEASFYACTNLQSLELPDAVTTIGSYAFRKCAELRNVTFSDSLENIGESSFYGCESLFYLYIPENVTIIQGYAFKGCLNLGIVELPDSLKTLGESAFHTCTGLDEITIPGGVTKIGEYCFSGSTGIDYIYFLGDAPAIGEGAFNKLTATAYYPRGNATWTSAVRQNYGGSITWMAQ